MHDLMGWWEFAFVPAHSRLCSFPQCPKHISFLCPHLRMGSQKKQLMFVSLSGFFKTPAPVCSRDPHARVFRLVGHGLRKDC